MTDALPAIPISFPLKTRLTDGTRILVRPLKPEDRNDLLKGFEKLSIASRRYRFLSPIRKLTERQLQLLLDMDNVNHVAIGVRDIGRLKKPGIAIGRMVRYEQQPEIAEFAITVIDEYQKRGIGTLLIRLLAGCAQGKGIGTLRGYLLDDNTAMIKLLENFGAQIQRDKGNVLQADLNVEAVVSRTVSRSPS